MQTVKMKSYNVHNAQSLLLFDWTDANKESLRVLHCNTLQCDLSKDPPDADREWLPLLQEYPDTPDNWQDWEKVATRCYNDRPIDELTPTWYWGYKQEDRKWKIHRHTIRGTALPNPEADVENVMKKFDVVAESVYAVQ